MSEEMNAEEIIRALRCISMVSTENTPCETCKYVYKELIPQDIIKRVDGQEYWIVCDCDRITLNAADLLEKLVGGADNG